jgi:hypothetical protein
MHGRIESQAMKSRKRYPRLTEEVESIQEHGPPGNLPNLNLSWESEEVSGL